MFPTPSIYAHIINGVLLLFAILLTIKHVYKIKTLDYYKQIKLVLIFSIAVGIHGLSHMMLDNYELVKKV
jgi:hypothetical protein